MEHRHGELSTVLRVLRPPEDAVNQLPARRGAKELEPQALSRSSRPASFLPFDSARGPMCTGTHLRLSPLYAHARDTSVLDPRVCYDV